MYEGLLNLGEDLYYLVENGLHDKNNDETFPNEDKDKVETKKVVSQYNFDNDEYEKH